MDKMTRFFSALSTLIFLITIVCCNSDDPIHSPPDVEKIPRVSMKKWVDAGITTISNLYAGAENKPEETRLDTRSTRHFSRFRFSDAALVTGTSPDWDIAFSTTEILVNGGYATRDDTGQPEPDEPERTGEAAGAIAIGDFEKLQSVEDIRWKQDNKDGETYREGYAIPHGSGKGWYNYDFKMHLVTPIAGRVLLFRTHDQKHRFKMQILSYYKNNPKLEELQRDQKIILKVYDRGGDIESDIPDTNKAKYARYYTFRYVLLKDDQV